MANFPIQGQQFDFSKMMSEMVSDRLNKSKAIEQEQKNPYVGQRELEALLMDRLKNKWYEPNIQSEIGLRGAQAGHLNKETSWMDRNNTSLNASRDMETKLNEQKYQNPGLGGSGAEHTAAVRQVLLDRGGQPAVEAHDQITKAYPDAPLKDTVAMAIQAANQLQQQMPQQLQQRTQMNPMAQNVQSSLMQQQGQQSIGQTPQIPDLSQSLNNAMQPQQPAPAKTTAQKNQVEIDNDIIDADLAYKRALSQSKASAAMGKGGKELALIEQEIEKQYPNMSPEDRLDARNQYMSGQTTFSDGRPLPPITPAIVDAISKNFKGSTDVNERQQQRFAKTADELFKKADTHIESASKFMTALGKAKGNVESVKGQFGEQSPDYLAFRNFIDEDVPAIVAEIVRAGGSHSTNAQKAQAISQVMGASDKGLSNPKLFLSNWKELKEIYRNVGKTVSAPAYQNANSLRGDNGQSSSANEHDGKSLEEMKAELARLKNESK